MSREDCFRGSWNKTATLLLMLVLVCCSACDDDDDGGVLNPPGPFTLTFSLDASFQGVHGGQPIHWALVRTSDAFVVAGGSGTVSATENPSFTFTTGAVLEKEIGYEVHYWIDSNIGGGTLGVCDLETIDHQWSTEFLSATNDINFTVSHNPALIEYVCDTFSP